jgi:hypothetical protein
MIETHPDESREKPWIFRISISRISRKSNIELGKRATEPVEKAKSSHTPFPAQHANPRDARRFCSDLRRLPLIQIGRILIRFPAPLAFLCR